jgi:hypothetical protein
VSRSAAWVPLGILLLAGCPPDRARRQADGQELPEVRMMEGGMYRLPEFDGGIVIRTDFSDDRAWTDLALEIRRRHGIFSANLHLIDDRRFEGLDKAAIAAHLSPEPYRSYLFLVDSTSIAHPEHPLLVVDLHERSLAEFRVAPRAVGVVENNLTLANVDFEEFAESADADGIYRQVP